MSKELNTVLDSMTEFMESTTQIDAYQTKLILLLDERIMILRKCLIGAYCGMFMLLGIIASLAIRVLL